MTAKQKKWRNRILLVLALFAALLVLDKTGRLSGIPVPGRFIIYLVPYLVIGYDVLRGAFLGMKNGQLFDEKFLMTIATFAAFGIGEYSEALAVMLFYQIGELFQSVAVGKSRKSIADMMSIAPEYANLETEDGVEETDPEDVPVGSIIVIRAGEKIPLDGTVISGESFVNTAALTGEPVPRRAAPGDPVISGCVNGEGVLRVRTEKIYEDSTVARILELVENASSRKARLENFITRFARWYTPVVTCCAVLLAVLPPLLAGGEWAEWVKRACIFLIVSCPCAMVISVPLGFFGGIGAASKIGVLVKGSNYLEAAAEMDTMVFDKTGTITRGEFEVTEIHPAEGTKEELLALAAAAESISAHPIAAAILRAYGKPVPADLVTDGKETAGHGIRARVGESEVLLGNARLMESEGIAFRAIESAGTLIYAAADGRFRGTIVIADRVKEGVPEAIRAMKKAGIRRVVMLTGDRRAAAEAVAAEAGIDEVHAELLPEDKVIRLEELLGAAASGNRAGAKVGFAGDGINDAPVLMRADVGIAMGSLGSDAAIEAADIVLMDDDIRKIGAVVRIARKTLAIVKENIAFAIGVKLLVLLLGALGIANMWEAVFADVGVCVIAILNSMRALEMR